MDTFFNLLEQIILEKHYEPEQNKHKQSFIQCVRDRANHINDIYHFEVCGIKCFVRSVNHFNWNGYVHIPYGHPDFGCSKRWLNSVYRVPGGINYSENDCIGFSTIVGPNDYCYLREVVTGIPEDGKIYKTFDFVCEQTKLLAQQVARRYTSQYTNQYTSQSSRNNNNELFDDLLSLLLGGSNRSKQNSSAQRQRQTNQFNQFNQFNQSIFHNFETSPRHTGSGKMEVTIRNPLFHDFETRSTQPKIVKIRKTTRTLNNKPDLPKTNYFETRSNQPKSVKMQGTTRTLNDFGAIINDLNFLNSVAFSFNSLRQCEVSENQRAKMKKVLSELKGTKPFNKNKMENVFAELKQTAPFIKRMKDDMASDLKESMNFCKKRYEEKLYNENESDESRSESEDSTNSSDSTNSANSAPSSPKKIDSKDFYNLLTLEFLMPGSINVIADSKDDDNICICGECDKENPKK